MLEDMRERMLRVRARCGVHISPYGFDQSAHTAAASYERKSHRQVCPKPTVRPHTHAEHKHVEMSEQK